MFDNIFETCNLNFLSSVKKQLYSITLLLRAYKLVHSAVISRGEVTINETSTSEKHRVQARLKDLKTACVIASRIIGIGPILIPKDSAEVYQPQTTKGCI